MDSLRGLRDSLDSSRPPAGPSKRHEKRLNQDFKAAALHLTNLYRSSLSTSQSSHRQGYLQGLGDILDLILLRASQAGATFRRDTVFDDVEGSHEMTASHKELMWLVHYLRARIEAIKSDSDDDDLEGDLETSAPHPPTSQPPPSSTAFANQAGSAASSSSRREPSSTPGLSIDQEDERNSPAASTAPNTPATRSHRTSRTQNQGDGPCSHESSSDDRSSESARMATTPARRAPSSAFSFSLAPSPVVSSMAASPSTHLRRKARGIHSIQQGGSYPIRSTSSGAATLPPVGEERVEADQVTLMDEDMREDRGHGRRGPVSRADGDLGKRRRKVSRNNSGGGAAGGHVGGGERASSGQQS